MSRETVIERVSKTKRVAELRRAYAANQAHNQAQIQVQVQIEVADPTRKRPKLSLSGAKITA